jgi:hypothetical protein
MTGATLLWALAGAAALLLAWEWWGRLALARSLRRAEARASARTAEAHCTRHHARAAPAAPDWQVTVVYVIGPLDGRSDTWLMTGESALRLLGYHLAVHGWHYRVTASHIDVPRQRLRLTITGQVEQPTGEAVGL